MANKITPFGYAIRDAIKTCGSSVDVISRNSGVSHQVIRYFINGRCRMCNNSARVVKDTVISEIEKEIINSQKHICTLEMISKKIKDTFESEYSDGEEHHE